MHLVQKEHFPFIHCLQKAFADEEGHAYTDWVDCFYKLVGVDPVSVWNCTRRERGHEVMRFYPASHFHR